MDTKKGIIQNHTAQFTLMYRAIDLIIIHFTLQFVCHFYDIPFSERYLILSFIAMISFAFLGEMFGLYRSWRTTKTNKMLLYTLTVWFLTSFVFLTFLFFSKTSADLSRVVVGVWSIIVVIKLMLWRTLFKAFLIAIRKKGYNSRKIAVLGVTNSGCRLVEELFENPEIGLDFHGFYDDRVPERLSATYSPFVKGSIDEGIDLAKNGGVDIVYIAMPMSAQDRIKDILLKLGDTTVEVHVVPDFFMFNLINSSIGQVGKVQTISVYSSPFSGIKSTIKRIEDFIGAALILLLIAIPMLIIALLIKLDSKGPVLFRQIRYGQDGKQIKVYKFRSMTTQDNGDVVKQATKNDARITKLGAILRRTSLDELPQFINVLQGRMSIVGPRPHAVTHNEEYRKLVDFYMLRHKVRPGITGWAQINGWRGETDTLEKMKKRIEFDLEYIREWSLFLDIKIIFLTILREFNNKNVH
jgi:putative colanic acid biosynthesis UDP-glucose lipid carrier transferase